MNHQSADGKPLFPNTRTNRDIKSKHALPSLPIRIIHRSPQGSKLPVNNNNDIMTQTLRNAGLKIEQYDHGSQSPSTWSEENSQLPGYQKKIMMATLGGDSFFPEAKKASLGTGIVGEAINSPKNSIAQQPIFAGVKHRKTRLPCLPMKR